MFTVNIYTDGACSGNPGPGGYGAILKYGDEEKIVRGYERHTTNNRMELTAVIEAVKALKKPCEVIVHTDSQYIVNASKHDKGWFTSEKRPNKDLWIELIETRLKGKHRITFQKVKGHSGDVMNERCDKIAKEQIKICIHTMFVF